jgi:hypothetical protein
MPRCSSSTMASSVIVIGLSHSSGRDPKAVPTEGIPQDARQELAAGVTCQPMRFEMYGPANKPIRRASTAGGFSPRYCRVPAARLSQSLK